MSHIKDNFEEVCKGIALSAKEYGRDPSSVKLIAVTKTYGPEAINEAIDCGADNIGENRVQEIIEKYGKVKPVCWHLIGHLQKNKVKYIIDKVELIHSVDSFELAEEINRRAEKIGKVQRILLEINVSGEESKFGIKPSQCEELCRRISRELKNVRVEGLMTVAPFTDDTAVLEAVFGGLRRLSEELAEKNIENIGMRELSMGMSNDYRLAVKHGATMVRVGTAIFGKRDYTNA